MDAPAGRLRRAPQRGRDGSERRVGRSRRNQRRAARERDAVVADDAAEDDARAADATGHDGVRPARADASVGRRSRLRGGPRVAVVRGGGDVGCAVGEEAEVEEVADVE